MAALSVGRIFTEVQLRGHLASAIGPKAVEERLRIHDECHRIEMACLDPNDHEELFRYAAALLTVYHAERAKIEFGRACRADCAKSVSFQKRHGEWNADGSLSKRWLAAFREVNTEIVSSIYEECGEEHLGVQLSDHLTKFDALNRPIGYVSIPHRDVSQYRFALREQHDQLRRYAGSRHLHRWLMHVLHYEHATVRLRIARRLNHCPLDGEDLVIDYSLLCAYGDDDDGGRFVEMWQSPVSVEVTDYMERMAGSGMKVEFMSYIDQEADQLG